MNNSSGFVVAIICVIVCLVLFARADRETRRAFCWIVVIFTIIGLAMFVTNPQLFASAFKP